MPISARARHFKIFRGSMGDTIVVEYAWGKPVVSLNTQKAHQIAAFLVASPIEAIVEIAEPGETIPRLKARCTNV